MSKNPATGPAIRITNSGLAERVGCEDMRLIRQGEFVKRAEDITKFWSASRARLECGGRVPSYRDGDTALDQSIASTLLRIQSAVAAALCRRTPNFGG